MEKGAIAGIGGMIMLAMALIVGLILLLGAAQNTNTVVNTVAVDNESLGTVLNSSVIYLTNYQSISGVLIYNASDDMVASTEYSVANKVIYNGALAVKITVDADDSDGQTGHVWTIAGTGEPIGYADGAARSITNLIVVMMALALVAVGVGYAVKSYND